MSQYTTGSGSFGQEGGLGAEGVTQLNSLLRGELSAVETYRMALEKVADSDKSSMDKVNILREVQSEHAEAVNLLQQRILAVGGEPSTSSGAWGAWAQTVQGTMNLFGDNAALKSLKEGEEHGLKDYEEALDDVDTTTRQLISSRLIPAQQRHISLLNQLMGTAYNAQQDSEWFNEERPAAPIRGGAFVSLLAAGLAQRVIRAA